MAEKLTMKSLNDKIEQLTKTVTDLEKKIEDLKPRDRGPASTRQMTEDDARRIILGDMRNYSHKEAAQELGLSYSQIYSARGGYTFRNVSQEAIDAKRK